MKAYNVSLIKQLYINNKTNKSSNDDALRFLRFENLCNANIINCIFTDSNTRIMIDEDTTSKIILLANMKFSEHITLEQMKDFECDEVFKLDFKGHEGFCNGIKELLEDPYYKSAKEACELKKQEDKKIKEAFLSRFEHNISHEIQHKKIVSLDFEFDQNKDFLIFEFGVSIYENGHIHNYHYLIEDHYQTKCGHYPLQFKFNFGKSTIIDKSEIIPVIKNFLKDSHYLLAHGVSSEYQILKHHGLDILEMEENLNMIDTQMVFAHNFRKKNNDRLQYTLKDSLRLLEMQYTNLHNSGNDAAYALGAFFEMKNRILANPERKKKIRIGYN